MQYNRIQLNEQIKRVMRVNVKIQRNTYIIFFTIVEVKKINIR